MPGRLARADARRPCALDGFEGQAVDHDLVDALRPRSEARRDQAAERRGERRVRAGAELLVLAADLRARPRDPAGKRQDHVRDTPASRDGGLGGGERRRRVGPEQDDVAAGDALDRAEGLLAGELAVHHGDPPVPPAFEPLRDLPAVAEIAKPAADVDRLLAERQPVVAGRRRAGHHALADPVRQRLFERIAAEREQQNAHAGPAVGRLVGPRASARSAASASQAITLVA